VFDDGPLTGFHVAALSNHCFAASWALGAGSGCGKFGVGGFRSLHLGNGLLRPYILDAVHLPWFSSEVGAEAKSNHDEDAIQ
jgi:hypothetical protein